MFSAISGTGIAVSSGLLAYGVYQQTQMGGKSVAELQQQQHKLFLEEMNRVQVSSNKNLTTHNLNCEVLNMFFKCTIYFPKPTLTSKRKCTICFLRHHNDDLKMQ